MILFSTQKNILAGNLILLMTLSSLVSCTHMEIPNEDQKEIWIWNQPLQYICSSPGDDPGHPINISFEELKERITEYDFSSQSTFESGNKFPILQIPSIQNYIPFYEFANAHNEICYAYVKKDTIYFEDDHDYMEKSTDQILRINDPEYSVDLLTDSDFDRNDSKLLINKIMGKLTARDPFRIISRIKNRHGQAFLECAGLKDNAFWGWIAVPQRGSEKFLQMKKVLVEAKPDLFCNFLVGDLAQLSSQKEIKLLYDGDQNQSHPPSPGDEILILNKKFNVLDLYINPDDHFRPWVTIEMNRSDSRVDKFSFALSQGGDIGPCSKYFEKLDDSGVSKSSVPTPRSEIIENENPQRKPRLPLWRKKWMMDGETITESNAYISPKENLPVFSGTESSDDNRIGYLVADQWVKVERIYFPGDGMIWIEASEIKQEKFIDRTEQFSAARFGYMNVFDSGEFAEKFYKSSFNPSVGTSDYKPKKSLKKATKKSNPFKKDIEKIFNDNPEVGIQALEIEYKPNESLELFFRTSTQITKAMVPNLKGLLYQALQKASAFDNKVLICMYIHDEDDHAILDLECWHPDLKQHFSDLDIHFNLTGKN